MLEQRINITLKFVDFYHLTLW